MSKEMSFYYKFTNCSQLPDQYSLLNTVFSEYGQLRAGRFFSLSTRYDSNSIHDSCWMAT